MHVSSSKNRIAAICFGIALCILFCWCSVEQFTDRAPLNLRESGSCTLSMDRIGDTLSESLVMEGSAQTFRVTMQSEKNQNIEIRCLILLSLLAGIGGKSQQSRRKKLDVEGRIWFFVQIILKYMQRSDGKKEPLLLS